MKIIQFQHPVAATVFIFLHFLSILIHVYIFFIAVDEILYSAFMVNVIPDIFLVAIQSLMDA